ncbi:MAG: glycoside hydrolase family 38 C-terminal domain-containing protein, partial [Verrucomicrobiota bacterium]
MLKHLAQTSERVKQLADAMAGCCYLEDAPVKISVFSAPDRIPFAEAVKGKFRPAQEGEKFGPRWSTHWFKLEIEIPKSWRGREAHLRFQSVSEALVWSADGKPLQGFVSANWAGKWGGFDDIRSHYVLFKRARGGEKLTLYVEAAITALMGFGMEGTKPELADPGFVGELKLCRIAVFDRAAWDLFHDLRTIDLLGRQLPEKHQLRLRANTAGNAIANTIDLAARATWPAARAIAAEFFKDNAGPRRFNVSATGHAHIDTAWLWPIAETIRKCARSFVSQIRLMEQYPEHKFVCSQAQQLAWMKERYPALFTDIQKQAKAGRFIPCGGSWIEPDCNLPSGESLVRQFLLGQRFYEREFGRRCREFWNPDVFGYSAAMPQIMRGAGIDYFLTQKLSWNQFNKPVSTTFLWEGLDGSRVLTHFPPADTYNGNCEPGELLASMENHKDAERSRESYYLFGFGDGGGGPTDAMLEKLRRQRVLDGMPAVEIRGPEKFFTRLEKDTRDPLVWSGELYFELHRGTYTTQAANKRDNRRAEETLHDAEFLAALAHATGRAAYPQDRLTRAWELTCLNQFHDIIPGSSINEVYRDSAKDYQEILATAAAVRDEAANALWPLGKAKNTGLLVLNTLSFPRREVVETPAGPRLLAAPSLGYAVADTEATAEDIAPVVVRRQGRCVTLENGLVRAELDAAGKLVSFRDLRANRECLAAETKGNQFALYEDKPLFWDAWDVDIFHLEKRRLVGEVTRIEVPATGPLLAKVEIHFQLT